MRLMNEGFKLSTADCVLPISDDIELDKDTLTIAYGCMKENYPDFDGIVGIKQRGLDNKTGVLLIGSKFLDRFPERMAFCPIYKGLYCDTELAEYAQSVDKFTYCDKAVVTHYHPSLYPNKKDETHDIGRQYKVQDINNWDRRRAKGLLWGRSFEL
ncbi:MAG: hypothetical protein M0P69_14850 [Bacteroidales bacterium]|nr:hypothetical protein [Bacteroidales bacterium]